MKQQIVTVALAAAFAGGTTLLDGITLLVGGAGSRVTAQSPAQASAPKPASSYRARLSQVPVDTPMLPNVTGSGTVTATLSGRTLNVTGDYEGLRTAATVARVHRGPKGIRGPAVFDLSVTGGTSGKVSGTIELSPSQLEDLARERLYVQLHSEKAPEGNLWGWLLPQETKR